MVSGHQEPAFTVASLATTTTSRPSTTPDAGDDARAGRLAVVLIVRHQQAELEPGRARVEQPLDPLAGRELALLVHLGDAGRAAACPEALGQRPVLVGERPQAAHGSRCSDAHDLM